MKAALRASRSLFFSALLLVVGKLVFLPFHGSPLADFFTNLTDCGLALLVLVAAWQAAYRSYPLPRIQWLGVAVASALWAISRGVGAFASLSGNFQEALNDFWPTTIIFYLVIVAFVVPLLVNEDPEDPGIGWLQALDIAQLAIITFSAYLVLFYIPANTEPSSAMRARYFMIVHLTGDGFLALAYLYRGWRSGFRDLRRLRFQLSAFFALDTSTSWYLHALFVWHWPHPLVGFVADFPVVFLLVTAVSWRRQEGIISQAEKSESHQGMLWAQLIPVLMPISVIILASRISTQYLRIAWIAVTSSFICYAARLFVMQRRQERGVTELKNVTEQLQQAQKMELIGSLAGGVAHDFNNLLTLIKSYSELAWKRGLNGELAEEIHQIREAADRAAGLTRQLLAFSRRQNLQPRNICLNAVLLPIEKLLRRTLVENIELVTSLAPDRGTVYVDPVQAEQVVMNLAVNARDAMPKGGKLLFETKNLELSVAYPHKGFEIPAGHYVVLTVTDTGTGIKPEHLNRIFEPFFTTKEVGFGTGLGLSTVYGIVKQSGGWISVYSEPGLGTTFKVMLPRIDSPGETFKPIQRGPESLSGTETVLVVDDDPRVCQLTANILSQYGYRVISSNSGDEALRRASELEGEIDLLVTDVAMARIDGRELAERLKAKRPGLKVLYMSGYPRFSPSDGRLMDFHEATLAKPFAPTDLAREARRTLSRS